MWSHLASPEDADATAAAVTAFERATSLLSDAGIPVPSRHLAATGGLFTERAPILDGVRLGLALYGVTPLDLPMPPRARAFADRLRPAMALKARPLRIERFSAGTPVGYSGAWRTPRESVIATLPVGYGDALPRSTWPGAEALVRSQRVPLVGNVAMDAVMADVTDVAGIQMEDEFVLLGEQGRQKIDVYELARARNTIPWEVLTCMSHRIPRVYHARSVLMGLRTLSGESRV
jgi:alanine racemase